MMDRRTFIGGVAGGLLAAPLAAREAGVSEWLLIGTTSGGHKVEVRGFDHYEFQSRKVIRKESYWKIVE